jgi:Fe-Mn family superoxide dismutase
VISARTLEFHYGKHHKTYVDTLNKLIAGHELADQPLEAIVRACAGKADKTKIFNNAAPGVESRVLLALPEAGRRRRSEGTLRDQITGAFGSVEQFRKDLATAAVEQFGSGWAWLVADGGKLKVVKTANADVPFVAGRRRCSRSTSGSTPTISITRTSAPITSMR